MRSILEIIIGFILRFRNNFRCQNMKVFNKTYGPTRACSGRRFASSKIVRFLAPVSATMSLLSIGGGAAKAQPVGRVSLLKLSRSRRSLAVFLAKECCAAPKKRIERGMNARCATWFRVALSQPRVVRVLVMLIVVLFNVSRNSMWYEGSWC